MAGTSSSLSRTSKKRKTSAGDDATSTIQTLEVQLTATITANGSLNPLADLLDIAKSATGVTSCSKAIYALYRVFVLIIARGMLFCQDKGSDDRQAAVHAWLMEKFDSYVKLLTGLLSDEEHSLKSSALQILFSLQKHLSSSHSKNCPSSSSIPQQPQFHISHFRKIVQALLICPPSHRAMPAKKQRTAEDYASLDAGVRDQLIDTWLNVHDDIRWFFLRESAGFLTSSNHNDRLQTVSNLLSILERITTFPTTPAELNAWWVEEMGARPPSETTPDSQEEGIAEPDGPNAASDWRKFFEEQDEDQGRTDSKGSAPRLHTLTVHQSLHSLASHKAIFTRCWLSIFPFLSNGGLEFGKALSLRVLNILHRAVIPHLTRPLLVMDWVGSCVDYGGTVGLLALNALFVLIKEYNLDYPSFYTRLYAFIDRDVLHLKHRARFFRLMEVFLSSTHLPASLLASFIKRLSRLSLNAPPSAIVLIIPFTYNTLRRHPSLMPMIHNSGEVQGSCSDPFRADEVDPTLTRALDSSLWELHAHVRHYHAAVSTLAGIFEEAFTRPSYAMEDFLDHTYGTLYDTEVKRKVRDNPALSGETRTRGTTDILHELWTF